MLKILTLGHKIGPLGGHMFRTQFYAPAVAHH